MQGGSLMVKTQRTFPEPASLAQEKKKANGEYNKEDVVKQLREIFHDKCYICELKNLQDPQVEHLLPHKNGTYLNRKFDWNNLFWACGHCNLVKMNSKYDVGIIDCCIVDPETIITFELKEGKINVKAKDEKNQQAVLTATLVSEVFTLPGSAMRDYKREMRFQELNREMNVLYDNLEKLNKNPQSKVVLRKLQVLLKRESAFAAFKRNYIRENSNKYPQLQQYIM